MSNRWSFWRDGSWTPRSFWNEKLAADYERQQRIIAEFVAECGWFGSRQYDYDSYWGCAL